MEQADQLNKEDTDITYVVRLNKIRKTSKTETENKKCIAGTYPYIAICSEDGKKLPQDQHIGCS